MKKSICSVLVGLLLIMWVIGTSTIEAYAAINLDDLDYNLNGVIDKNDLARIKVNYLLGRYDIKYDLNKDNKIDIFDITIITKEIGKETPTLRDNMDITSKFTDENFKNAVYALIGKTSSESILYSDVKNIEEVNVNSMNIASLSGIEYFTALTTLMCNDNQISTLDASKNIALTRLYCSINKLTTLDVSNNTALTALNCAHNQLTTLDVSKNTKLDALDCGRNQLTTLDVNMNIALTYLKCDSNQLTTLDVSKNIELTLFWCENNQLTTLDVSKINSNVNRPLSSRQEKQIKMIRTTRSV